MKALIFGALVLAAILLAARWGDDRHPLAVDASVECETVTLSNPCDETDCFKVDPKEIA